MNLGPGTRLRVLGALCLLAVLGLWAAGPAAPGHAPAREKVTVTLLATTDLHGNIFPIDYWADRPANRGLAKIATLVRQERATNPNALLLDCGDTIQGTPLAYYFAVKETSRPNPTIAVMNDLHYAATALGNHEFNYGLDVLWKAKREARFPILAANLRQEYKKDTNEYFRPYIIKTVGGVRVAIVGFVTPGVPRWEVPANYRGYQFEPIVESAQRVIPEVRKQADLVVVLAHSGLGPDPELKQQLPADELDGENAVAVLAERVPGIDVILFGHTHQELPERTIHGVLVMQPKNWGQSLGRVQVEMEREGAGAWRVAAKHSTSIPVTDSVAADPEILKLAQPYEEYTQRMLNAPVATSAKDMNGSLARYQDDPLVDLIHKVQMQEGHADVSLATMLLASAHIPAGQVTSRNIASLYIYSNTLYVVEMTGAQLKEALEHAASFFSGWPLQPGERIRLPGYNADSAEGVSYIMDLSRPVGDRIRELTFQGKPLDPGRKLRVAINNYRYTGGGHYDMFRDLPIVYRSAEEVRDLILEYVTRAGTIPTTADGNWRLEPKAALEAIIEEAKRMETRPTGPSSR
jgi:2',3'-cyclic-nucleotide 2'-phosphodiesterase/3'-nucleotidase